MAFKLDENLREAFLKHRRGEYDQKLDGEFVFHINFPSSTARYEIADRWWSL